MSPGRPFLFIKSLQKIYNLEDFRGPFCARERAKTALPAEGATRQKKRPFVHKKFTKCLQMATEMRGKMRGKNKTHRRINSNGCYTGRIVCMRSIPSPRARARPRVFSQACFTFYSFFVHMYHAVSHRDSLHFP